MKDKKQKEIRLNNVENLQIRNDEQEENKMVIEGYPIVFDKETYIDCFFGGWYEKIDRNAFANADMSDVCLKYNHNDDFFIMARTRNNSLQLTIDDHGVFMHAELINTTQNRDVYEMVKSELLKEGSFAFTVEEWTENIDANEDLHRTINKIGKLFDVAICPNGAYGDMTEIYARSYDLLENNHKKLESLKRCKLLKLRNKNKIKLLEAKK
jgi:HK97 family phage prohead protease|nr:MAG TPA: prohead serine protease [Caudoviricetes sp.]